METCTRDRLHPACRSLRDTYELDARTSFAKFTVPMLWDTKTDTIVNNESSEVRVVVWWCAVWRGVF